MSISDYIDNISSSIVKLSGGLNNDVFTETDSETILRKYHNSINFQSKNYELKLISILSYVNLAPKIIKKFTDGHIEEKFTGKQLSLFEANSNYIHISKKLAKIHKINRALLDIRKLDKKIIIWDWINYEYKKLSQVGKKYLNNLLGDYREVTIAIKRMRRIIDKINCPVTICHNDLTLGNILQDHGDIKLIDWEFLGANPLFFDLASLIYNLNLNDFQKNLFLDEYASFHPDIVNIIEKVDFYLAPNRLLWLLWGLNKLDSNNDAGLKQQINDWGKCFLKNLNEKFPPNVYVVGVFDILHLGHMNLLKKAKEWARGGKLIVGVHNDKDTKSYKRLPYIDQDTRVSMLKHLKWPDLIIENGPFCRDTDMNFYHKYDIDYHLAGEDTDFYKPQKEMGVFKLIDSGNTIHTTNIIDKIKKQ